MHPLLLRTRARLRDAGKSLGGAAVGALTIAMLRTTRYFDPVKTGEFFRPRHPHDRPAAARAAHRPR